MQEKAGIEERENTDINVTGQHGYQDRFLYHLDVCYLSDTLAYQCITRVSSLGKV